MKKKEKKQKILRCKRVKGVGRVWKREKSKLRVAQYRLVHVNTLYNNKFATPSKNRTQLPLQLVNLIFLLASSCHFHHILWTFYILLMFILIKIQFEIMLYVCISCWRFPWKAFILHSCTLQFCYIVWFLVIRFFPSRKQNPFKTSI